MNVRLAALAVVLSLSACLAPAQQYTWTTIAGQPPLFGSTDGSATDARFYNPNSLVVDAAGTIYVTDTFNHTIRKITPNGLVTTAAGRADTPGSADGAAADARFNFPAGLLFDSAGDLWIVDSGNHTLRRLSTDGTVTTIAGQPGTSGSADGTGSAARFLNPFGLALDAGGDLFLADSGNHTVRRITPSGTVTTFVGTAGLRGTTSATGAAARFNFPSALAFDATGDLLVADTSNDCIRRVTPAGVVTVFAGSADIRGSTNGTGTVAHFYNPFGIA
eukprot:gene50197-61426_t